MKNIEKLKAIVSGTTDTIISEMADLDAGFVLLAVQRDGQVFMGTNISTDLIDEVLRELADSIETGNAHLTGSRWLA